MNVNPESAPVPDTEEAASDATPKPVRKRRAAKVVVEPVAIEVLLAEAPPADVVFGNVDAAPKPRRRRAAVEKVEAVDAGSAIEPPPPEDPPVQQAPVPSAVSEPVFPEAAAVTAEEAQPPAENEPATEAADGAPRSERGRRRGRRDRGASDDLRAADVAAEGEPAAIAVADSLPVPQEAGELFAQVLSGRFDVEEDEPAEVADETATTKRILQPEADAPKLHKVLAQSGIGSRRDMEDLIADGHVMVNGEVAHVGQRISFGDQVKVNGKPVRLRIVPPLPRIIAYHKPVGEIVSHDDPQNRPTVFRRLPRLAQGKWQSVGRLDINTEGLLLFTNSGELANQLMHPRFGVEREYAVRVLGRLEADAKAKLLEGVDVEGQKASFRAIEEGGGDGANHWYRVVITEGRNREVRKLFDTVGLTVSRLIRIRYGTVVLPLGLKRGVCVDLEEGDVRAIRRLASVPQQPPRDAARPARNNDRQNDRMSDRPNDRPNDRNGDRVGGPPPQRNDRQNARGNDRGNDRGRNNGNNNPRNRPDQPAGFAPAIDDARPRDADIDRDDADLDFDPASIPNPLEQTFDKRFVQNPRSPAGGRGFGRGGGGFGAGGSAPAPAKPQKGGGPKQPDPLQTSLGFIGADAFHRKGRGGQGGGGQGGGGNRGGNRGGGGYGGGNGGGGGGGGFGGGNGGGGRRSR